MNNAKATHIKLAHYPNEFHKKRPGDLCRYGECGGYFFFISFGFSSLLAVETEQMENGQSADTRYSYLLKITKKKRRKAKASYVTQGGCAGTLIANENSPRLS